MTSAEQFSRTAAAYLASEVHARGADLLALAAVVRALAPALALDVGTNVGHTLRAIAPHCGRAVGTDVAVAALRLGRSSTAAPNVAFVEADAVALPFRDASVPLVCCRLAAHHFPDRARAFAEIARVLAPGGTFLLADNHAPEDAEQDRFINALEALRDPTHERAETIAGWTALLERAGLGVRVEGTWGSRLVTEEWLARAETPRDAAARVREALAAAAPAVREAFGIDGDSFVVNKVLLRATAPG